MHNSSIFIFVWLVCEGHLGLHQVKLPGTIVPDGILPIRTRLLPAERLTTLPAALPGQNHPLPGAGGEQDGQAEYAEVAHGQIG